jgi:hypothetical protein
MAERRFTNNYATLDSLTREASFFESLLEKLSSSESVPRPRIAWSSIVSLAGNSLERVKYTVDANVNLRVRIEYHFESSEDESGTHSKDVRNVEKAGPNTDVDVRVNGIDEPWQSEWHRNYHCHGSAPVLRKL